MRTAARNIRRHSWWQRSYLPLLLLFYLTIYSPCWWGVVFGDTEGRYLMVLWVFAVPVTLGLVAASSFSFDVQGPEPIGWRTRLEELEADGPEIAIRRQHGDADPRLASGHPTSGPASSCIRSHREHE